MCILTGIRRLAVNEGEATSRDVPGLIRLVQEEVRTHHGVDLELEVQVWS